ncbi:MAG TPA: hypothetical protein VII35_16605 [Steroidobacteraceae bacterium]
MKNLVLMCVCLAVGSGSMAMAEEAAGPDPQTLGTLEAVINKCAQVDAPNAERYHGQVEMAVQGASKELVSKARGTDAYQEAYASATKSFESVKDADAVKSCRKSLVSAK